MTEPIRQVRPSQIDPIQLPLCHRARWMAGCVALHLQLALHRGQLTRAIHLARQTLTLASPR